MEPDPDDPNDDDPSEEVAIDLEALRTIFMKGKSLSLRSLGLPITVILKSEVETTSIFVDMVGNVSVSRGALPEPDVIIEGSHASMCEILQTRSPTLTAPGALKVTINSGERKGEVIEISEGELMENPLTDLLGL
jgi:hypothetical protein